MLPVFICSKGRAGKAKCIEKLLDEKHEALHVFVEPQDIEAYEAAYPELKNLHMLPENDQGITYVRNYMLDHAKEMNSDYWQLDDDITTMGEVIGAKVHKRPFTEVLEEAYAELKKWPEVAVGALEYGQFAWAAKKDFAFNSYCDTCVVVMIKNLGPIRYRPDTKEDRDICLQVLTNGLQTARTTKYCFNAPKNGSNAGGLHDDYAGGLESKWSQNMMKLWPMICKPSKKKDRDDVKINWAFFKAQRPAGY